MTDQSLTVVVLIIVDRALTANHIDSTVLRNERDTAKMVTTGCITTVSGLSHQEATFARPMGNQMIASRIPDRNWQRNAESIRSQGQWHCATRHKADVSTGSDDINITEVTPLRQTNTKLTSIGVSNSGSAKGNASVLAKSVRVVVGWIGIPAAMTEMGENAVILVH